MTAKTVDLSLTLRDETGFAYSAQNAVGTTEDDGATVVIPLGYLPNIVDAPLVDLAANVLQPAAPLTPTRVVSRTDDFEAGTSTIVFGFD